MGEEARLGHLNTVLGVLLCAFTLSEVNYPRLAPQSQLAIFALLGLVLCFLNIPAHPRLLGRRWFRGGDLLLAVLAVCCCAYIVVQTEPLFEGLWTGGQNLGNRAGQETPLDTWVGVVGLLLVIEATRRAIGWALPALSLTFIAYAYFGPAMPDWLFPHRGYGVERIVAQTFLHSQGVFGTALHVMFVYVFLFVVFGALLKSTGATQYIIDFAQRIFGGTPGAPAKVAVLSSGMMGSLSGSAVANTATTGTFTIPMMRSAGFEKEIAGGVEAAASSGGALMPPVMGAGAYMMLEIVEPAVTYLQIIKAALIPAILYYFSLLLIVHLYSKRIGVRRVEAGKPRSLLQFEGLLFFSGFAVLITFLAAGSTVSRSVSLCLLVLFVVSQFNSRTRLGGRKGLAALTSAAREVVPLVAAAACVGIVIGVVTLTGIGTKLPSTILGLAQGSLLSALLLIMISSIILGMGLPSAVCYLLMATLIGPVLSKLGVVPLAAHLFIFYFGMMSMVTPPVALAAYTASAIAESGILSTSLAAFRFALVGFTLPYMFVFRPQLLMLSADGATAGLVPVAAAAGVALLGIVPFAAGISGYLFAPLSRGARALLFASALLLLLPGLETPVGGRELPLGAIAGFLLLALVGLLNHRAGATARR